MIIFTCINKGAQNPAIVWANTLKEQVDLSKDKIYIFHTGDVDVWRFNHLPVNLVRVEHNNTEGGCFNEENTNGMTMRLRVLDMMIERQFSEKVWYFDSDFLFMKPLTELENCPLTDQAFLAARNDHVRWDDPRIKEHYVMEDAQYKHKKALHSDYFNSGAMGIFLPALQRRLQHFGYEKLMDFYEAKLDNYIFPDQDCLNELVDEYVLLPDHFNTLPELQFKIDFGDIMRRLRESYNSHAAHFCGRIKPWTEHGLPNQSLQQLPLDLYVEEVRKVRSFVDIDWYRAVMANGEKYAFLFDWMNKTHKPTGVVASKFDKMKEMEDEAKDLFAEWKPV